MGIFSTLRQRLSTGLKSKKDREVSGTNTPNSDAVLTRLQSDDDGTFGTLSMAGFSCFTGELPNRDNASNISCIPKGIYECIWTYSPRMKRFTYELKLVAGRTAIRIHSANFMGLDSPPKKKQLNGCITLGQKLGLMDGQKAVLLSAPAIRQFETLMNGQPFMLEIKDAN